ncbi:LAMI_0F04522g1_1 [Lachancea mirantina]|uniref:Folylpolyglutamate synthase n=1 Tax=Lachancea mirantina TaxID=1230905 RepID=A0A1G4JY07_9SACH|nr:LAMI_0F04522g1_1 [Lachancea mirantina]
MKLSMALNMASRTYKDAVASLNSLQSNYANIMAIRASGERKNQMNIWEMQEWSRRVGYSVSDYSKLNIIHITGTKGKGSTAAFAQSILQQYGSQIRKVGLYTSPHLKSVRERIRVDGAPISEEKFTKYFFEVWDRLEATRSPEDKFPHMVPGSKPGYFKYLTLLSFHVFMQEGCDSCIYEVGVGGEYDSTNIIEKPTACGVSLLGIDHTFMLGDTITEIAWNKGGIFKTGTKAFSITGQPSDGLRMLQERAEEKKTSLSVVPIFNELKNVKLGIAGDFQIKNASLSVALAHEHLSRLNILQEPLELSEDAKLPQKFIEGLQNTEWSGRCQTVKDGQITWYIDGAHTKESIEAASGWFKSVAVNSASKKILLFNQQTRNAGALIKYLHETLYPELKLSRVIFSTNVTWKSGDYSADLVSMNTSKDQVDKLEVQTALRDVWQGLEPNSDINVTSSIEAAREIIKNEKEPVDVFVTGSLHLVGGLLVVFDGTH